MFSVILRRNGEKLAISQLFTGVVLALILGLSATARGAGSGPEACGLPGRPPCPLQRWMRDELAKPVAAKDAGATAGAFERLAKLNPEPKKWLNWTKFANEGARAARDGRPSAVSIACDHCHSIYRGEYKIKYRRRAIR